MCLLLLPVRGDLIRTVNKLLKRRNKFDAIIIETTGLANPAPVIQVWPAQPAQTAGMETAVDAQDSSMLAICIQVQTLLRWQAQHGVDCCSSLFVNMPTAALRGVMICSGFAGCGGGLWRRLSLLMMI